MNKVIVNATLFVVLVSPVFAEMQTLTFKIGQQMVKFKIMPEFSTTISEDCVHQGKIGTCDASKAMRKADLGKLSYKVDGGNPGARICSEQVHGQVIWVTDEKGNERTFCKFKDGSLISNASLMVQGKHNSN